MNLERASCCFGALAALMLLGLAGCGGSGAKPVKTEGVVTLDGAPLAGATVVFQPAEGTGRPATGLTSADGSFRLTTFNTGDGAMPGEYKIVVTKSADERGDAPDVGQGNTSDSRAVSQKMGKMMIQMATKQKKGEGVAKSGLPAQYSDPGRTILRAKVPTEGRVEITLKSKGGS
jgi:hypothetical protein